MTTNMHGAMPGQVTPEFKTDTTAKITQLLHIGTLAIDLHKEKSTANSVRDIYRRKLKESGQEFDGLKPDDDAYTEIIEFTKGEYKAYQAAKRRVYNAQRRLDNACHKAALPGAMPC
ncbi:MAG: hypothetical protein Q7K57_26420 [Burkholderiaceae bacterium]|nr:hypothetical protein [Burkholderiaceae bacterium]